MKKMNVMAASALLLSAGFANAQGTPSLPGNGMSYTYENTIQVNGNAEQEVVPD